MKIIAIGDLHGSSIWKDIVAQETFDRIVFMGDYFDTFRDISIEQQVTNFHELLDYKLNNRGKVRLLIGNHDYHYMNVVKETYSGFNSQLKVAVEPAITNAIILDLMQVCHNYDNILFTHAGVTTTFLDKIQCLPWHDVCRSLNSAFRYHISDFEFTIGENNSIYGDDVCQSPLWVRPKSLMADAAWGYRQVVGHTEQNRINLTDMNFFFIDTIHSSGEYLCIEDRVFSARRL